MPQRFRVDRQAAAAYLALFTLACTPKAPAPLGPLDMAPVSREAVAGWVAATSPAGHRLVRFNWRWQDERGSAGGKGSARVAGPDSVRLDMSGPFGAGRSAGVVIGDSALWTDPPDAIERIVPSYPLMWALFGVARMPAEGVALVGRADSAATSWQAVTGTDTVVYVRTRTAPKLLTEVRQAGKVLGRVETAFGPDGRPTTSRLTVPSLPARLDITFTASDSTAPFPARLWMSGRP